MNDSSNMKYKSQGHKSFSDKSKGRQYAIVHT